MNRKRFLKWILFFALLINHNSMIAQDNTNANQSLNAQQKSIAGISASTAVGNLETLKIPLNMDTDMMIRISEIEIVPEYLKAYNAILKEESAISIKIEPGVIAIFPMYQKENPTQIRIVEIYANRAAYEQHLKTPHFQKYKTTTLKMVKSLKLVDMGSLDIETMPEIFKKIK